VDKKGILLKTGLLDFEQAWHLQKDLHQRCVEDDAEDTLILTEHPHTYTLGKSGKESHLIANEVALAQRGITVYRIDRGGDITYHGPGQIVGYPIINLRRHYLDVHRFLRDLEEVLIRTLASYDIEAGRTEGLTGVWVRGAKVAAIGVKVARWVTMHGFAFNVNTDLSYFQNIVPCGISDKPVTSLGLLLGRQVDFKEVVDRVRKDFEHVFGLQLQEVALTAADGFQLK
jgi:lipoyl(octanoyl) transferase